MKDKLTHGRKTTGGLDRSFGLTVTTPCGKRRKTGDTSARAGQVTCPDCRDWFAAEERQLAGSARAADRRAWRAAVAQMSDATLAYSMSYYAGVIQRWPAIAIQTNRVASLRALRHEAIVVRGWDAHDDFDTEGAR